VSRTKHAEVVAFLGPSLRADEARALCPGVDLRGPARQGDVLEALRSSPRVIALIDGVFESQPSVWHQELRIALGEGVVVLGASSMGALRAAELAPFGMRGVGGVFEAYRSGRLVDDADVALLHADAENDFRPLTLPLVAVVAAAEAALAAGVLPERAARTLFEAARAIHYKDRRWPDVLAAWKATPAQRAALDAHRRAHPVDPKADDARACLAEAKRLCDGPPGSATTPSSPSVWARRAWVARQGQADVDTDGRDGLRTLLLAEWARSSGLVPDEVTTTSFEHSAEDLGLDAGLRRRFAEALSLEAVLLSRPGLLLAKAPDLAEGRWVEAMRAAAEGRPRKPRRRN
jgi:hypothetical protein